MVTEHTTRTGYRVVVDVDTDAEQVTVTAWSGDDGTAPALSTLRRIAARYLRADLVLMHPWEVGASEGRRFIRGVYA